MNNKKENEKIIINPKTHCIHCLTEIDEDEGVDILRECSECGMNTCSECYVYGRWDYIYHMCCCKGWQEAMHKASLRPEFINRPLRDGEFCPCIKRMENLQKIKRKIKENN